MSHGIVIVGAGECGARAAMALRENGYQHPVTLIGAEHLLPYERPPLSKEAITSEQPPIPKTVTTPEALSAAGISCLTGREVTAIDRSAQQVELDNGDRLSYERLLLATGARARQLPAAVDPEGQVCYLRTFADAERLRDRLHQGCRLVVIGGGFIGLELAASARKRGAEVTVIEFQPRVLMRAVPEPIATAIMAHHQSQGVRVLCSTGVKVLEAGHRVVLDNGEVIEADLIVGGIGAVPETGLAEAAGLAVDNGIKVDQMLCSDDPAIFAAGDCCSFPLPLYDNRRVRLEAWRNAQDQGTLVAANLTGAGQPVVSVPWFWSDQYHYTLQMAGLADQASDTVRRDLGDDAFILFHLATDGRLVAASGIGPGNAVAKDIRLSEMLIARQARPDPEQLASPSVNLKKLLKG